MLIGIDQRDTRLTRTLRDNGCLFLCFAEESPLIFKGNKGCEALNYLWQKALKDGIISSAYILQEHTRLAQDYFALDIQYDEFHHDADEEIPENVAFVFGQFLWKQKHFVIIDRNKKVIFDPLVNSYSVQNGELISMRFYYAV